MQIKKQQLEPGMEQQTGSKLGKENDRAAYCHPAYLTYMHSVCMLSRFSHVILCGTLWTVAYQAPLYKGFSRQEYWSGLPCPSPGALSDPGIEHTSRMSPALAGTSFTTSAT